MPLPFFIVNELAVKYFNTMYKNYFSIIKIVSNLRKRYRAGKYKKTLMISKCLSYMKKGSMSKIITDISNSALLQEGNCS